ncbi:anaerobic glycerol-3-phosphate dehydrogenase subunit GlpA [Bacillaceae bacterium S4-13-56]
MGKMFETDVVVIGGGMTGLGVLRDLTLRGIQATLIEQRDLIHGTSSRNHGLLHSGARYAVRDEEAAIESYKENLILKKTIPGSVEACGGLFVKVPQDEDAYVKQWIQACEKIGIPIEEMELDDVLKREPFLNKDIQVAYSVPDGAVDPFTMSVDVAADSVKRGAQLLTYHEVIGMITDQHGVKGVKVRNFYTKEEFEIFATIVVNAAGPWGAQLATLAGLPLKLINNKGMLSILNHRINQRVINRLRMPGDADIFVPAHNVTIFGTTGKNVEDPNDTSLDQHEFEQMLEIGTALVPNLKKLRMIRAFSGSRPLYQDESKVDDSGRSLSRGLVLLDHHERDGMDGFITITGGKLTTFRYMAEKTVDLISQKLGGTELCSTHEEVVPHRETMDFKQIQNMAPAAMNKLSHWAGFRSEAIKKSMNEDEHGKLVVCECEQVTWSEVVSAIQESGSFHIGNIRRRTRLGMGPCQGTYCNQRVASLAVEKGIATPEEANIALQEALQSRQKGMYIIESMETKKQLQFMDTMYHVSLGIPKGGSTACMMLSSSVKG